MRFQNAIFALLLLTLPAISAFGARAKIANPDIRAGANIDHAKMAAVDPDRVLVSSITGKAKASSTSTTVLGYVNNLTGDAQAQLNAGQAHINDSVGAHAASAVSNTPTGNTSSTDVQSAINELQGDIDTITGAALTVRTITADETLTDARDIMTINVAGGNVTLTAHAASSAKKKAYYIFCTGLGYVCSLAPTGSDTLHGKQRTRRMVSGDAVIIKPDGTSNWIFN